MRRRRAARALALGCLACVALRVWLSDEGSAATISTYFCGAAGDGDLSRSYAGAWLATRGRFERDLPFGMPFLKKPLRVAAMRAPGFNLTEALEFRAARGPKTGRRRRRGDAARRSRG